MELTTCSWCITPKDIHDGEHYGLKFKMQGSL